VTASLVAFAANSLLTRSAIESGAIGAPTFALVRILTGALVLAALVRVRPSGPSPVAPTWGAAWALSGYFVAFTAAYTRIGAAAGALLLFSAVQVTMVASALVRGERPGAAGWTGGALAAAGLLVLTLPGATATDLRGAALMIAAGACWGAYSLIGRGSRDPLGETARNFVRSGAVLAVPLAWADWPPAGTSTGLALAAASGALASGFGYTIWYSVLPSLSAWRAAILQLSVPVLTAVLAFVVLNEPLTVRLVLSGALVAIGVWLTASPRWRR
jgi:drug/metabolite transporter (DMT)-like permease